jgi:hypothetical protein
MKATREVEINALVGEFVWWGGFVQTSHVKTLIPAFWRRYVHGKYNSNGSDSDTHNYLKHYHSVFVAAHISVQPMHVRCYHSMPAKCLLWERQAKLSISDHLIAPVAGLPFAKVMSSLIKAGRNCIRTRKRPIQVDDSPI